MKGFSQEKNFLQRISEKKHLEKPNIIYIMKQNETKNMKNMQQKFLCYECDYRCNKKFLWKQHLNTRKHKMKQNETKICKNMQNSFQCEYCSRAFNSRTTLWRHKKKCDPEINHKIYKELVKMNEKAAEKTVNQTINNNQKISINVFLDKYCGKAMNLKDFLDTLSVTVEDLDITHKLGYVDGMSSIFIKNLKDLPTVKRPIHCCDSKRGKFYIKDEDKWEKETGEKIEKVIDRLQIKHIKTIKEWEKAHPNYLKDEKLLLKWNEMIHNIMGPYQTEERHKNKKIIVKNVGDEVSIKEAMKDIEK